MVHSSRGQCGNRGGFMDTIPMTSQSMSSITKSSRRSRLLRLFIGVIAFSLLLFVGTAAYRWWDVVTARREAPRLVAAALEEAAQRGSVLKISDLTARREAVLLAIEDPAFRKHHGVDFSTPGAGWTTITQGLVKLLYFPEGFKAGIAKIRQILIAEYALDAVISKDEQLTLYLNITYLGNHDGKMVRGYAEGARIYYQKNFQDLSEREFISLVGMTISPNDLIPGTKQSAERVEAVERYLSGAFVPTQLMDVEYRNQVRDNGISGSCLLEFLKLLTKDRPNEW
jgi:membrane peptidoglycan carboxypeptidase